MKFLELELNEETLNELKKIENGDYDNLSVDELKEKLRDSLISTALSNCFLQAYSEAIDASVSEITAKKINDRAQNRITELTEDKAKAPTVVESKTTPFTEIYQSNDIELTPGKAEQLISYYEENKDIIDKDELLTAYKEMSSQFIRSSLYYSCIIDATRAECDENKFANILKSASRSCKDIIEAKLGEDKILTDEEEQLLGDLFSDI